MRYLVVLLLLSGVCRGQKQNENYNKVTAYHFIEITTDAPCFILDYITQPVWGTVFTVESCDKKMISDLLKIKKDAFKWKSEYHDCGQGGTGYLDMTSNMFVFSGNATNDTLFTTEGNHAVVLPKKFKRYLDKDKRIEKSLTGDFVEFFKRDFREDMWFTMVGDLDSIPNNSVLFKGKKFDRTAKIEDFGTESFVIEIDTMYHGNDSVIEAKKYSLDRNIYSFNYKGQLENVEVFNINDYYIDGVKPGDHEDVLLKKYPNSTQRQFPMGTKFEEIKQNYAYTVNVENERGHVYYHIKNRIVYSITISLPF